MIVGAVVRFIVAALVLLLVSWLLPGFSVAGFRGALVAALIIAVLGYAVEAVLGRRISHRNRGIVGFFVSAAVIYFAQFIIPHYLTVSVLGALLAAVVIGVLDVFVPTPLRSP